VSPETVVAFNAANQNIKPENMEEFIRINTATPPVNPWVSMAATNLMEKGLSYTLQRSLKHLMICQLKDNNKITVFFALGPENFKRCDQYNITNIEDFKTEILEKIDVDIAQKPTVKDMVTALIARVEALTRQVNALKQAK
jgi:hypothetical protein